MHYGEPLSFSLSLKLPDQTAFRSHRWPLKCLLQSGESRSTPAGLTQSFPSALPLAASEPSTASGSSPSASWTPSCCRPAPLPLLPKTATSLTNACSPHHLPPGCSASLAQSPSCRSSPSSSLSPQPTFPFRFSSAPWTCSLSSVCTQWRWAPPPYSA